MINTPERASVIVRGLLKLGSDLHRLGDKITGEYGLNQQQFVVLSEIVNRGPINQTQLVGGLVIEKSNLSKIVKKLRTMGLIESSSSPDDGRATLLSVTKKGKTVWEDCMERFNGWQASWASPLSDGEMAQITKVLERLKGLPV